jgi:chitinase
VRTFLLLAAIFAGGCTTTPQIVGYYAGWKEATVDARKLTVINYAFVDLGWSLGGQDRDNVRKLAALKERNPDLRLVASVGGWSSSQGFSDMAADPAARERFIAGAIAFMRQHDFDGVDIDWEYPTAIGAGCDKGRTCERPEDKRNFVALSREMRRAFDSAGARDRRTYLITIAAGVDGKWMYDRGSADWMRELAASLDWINLMTYDYHGTWENAAGFLAPFERDPADPWEGNVTASVEMYLREGIPARKITLGLPFYGKGWIGCTAPYQPCTSPIPDPPESTYAFGMLTDEGYLTRDAEGNHTVGARGFERHWNPRARAPYLYNPDKGVFISYDDEASIREKLRYAKSKGLLGAMYWEIAADRHGVLADVVSRELPR